MWQTWVYKPVINTAQWLPTGNGQQPQTSGKRNVAATATVATWLTHLVTAWQASWYTALALHIKTIAKAKNPESACWPSMQLELKVQHAVSCGVERAYVVSRYEMNFFRFAIIYILRRHSLTTRWWTDHVWFMCYVYAIACHLLLHGIWLLWKEVGICMMPHRSWATKVIAWLAACCCVTYWVAPIIPWQLHAYSYISIMQPIVYVFVIATTIRIAVVAGNSSRAAALSHTIYPSHSYFSWNLWLISHVRVALLHGWYVIRFVAPLNYLLPQSII